MDNEVRFQKVPTSLRRKGVFFILVGGADLGFRGSEVVSEEDVPID